MHLVVQTLHINDIMVHFNYRKWKQVDVVVAKMYCNLNSMPTVLSYCQLSNLRKVDHFSKQLGTKTKKMWGLVPCSSWDTRNWVFGKQFPTKDSRNDTFCYLTTRLRKNQHFWQVLIDKLRTQEIIFSQLSRRALTQIWDLSSKNVGVLESRVEQET